MTDSKDPSLVPNGGFVTVIGEDELPSAMAEFVAADHDLGGVEFGKKLANMIDDALTAPVIEAFEKFLEPEDVQSEPAPYTGVSG